MPLASTELSATLRSLIVDLQTANDQLKADHDVEPDLIPELRHALDNLRMTAWTASELQNARKTRKDTRAAMSFLTAERIRRIRQMIDDLCADLERDGTTWQGLDDLRSWVRVLRTRLSR